MVKAIDLVMDILLPKICLFCSGLMNCYVCPQCMEKYLQSDDETVLPPQHVDRLITSVVYNPAVARVVTEIKYNFHYRISEVISEMMKQRLEDSRLIYDVICPVPLSRKRKWWRGFNQSEVIAKAINPLKFSNLIKRQHAQNQVGLNREQRLRNLEGKFSCNSNLDGLSVVVVDDIVTTGATLSGCAHALKQAGASQVTALVWARD